MARVSAAQRRARAWRAPVCVNDPHPARRPGHAVRTADRALRAGADRSGRCARRRSTSACMAGDAARRLERRRFVVRVFDQHGQRRGEQVELRRGLRRRLLFQMREMLARRANHRVRHAGQLRDLQTVALIRRTFAHRVQEHDAVSVLDRREMHIGRMRKFGGQLRQLEVMRGEQRMTAVVREQMPRDGPGQREAVERRRAAADFVHQHETLRRRVVQDRGGFRHFDHEGRTAAGQVVGCADAREDAVDRAERARAVPARSCRHTPAARSVRSAA